MDSYEKSEIVKRLESGLGRIIIGGDTSVSLAAKRKQLEKELAEIDFLEDAVRFIEKWSDRFPRGGSQQRPQQESDPWKGDRDVVRYESLG